MKTQSIAQAATIAIGRAVPVTAGALPEHPLQVKACENVPYVRTESD